MKKIFIIIILFLIFLISISSEIENSTGAIYITKKYFSYLDYFKVKTFFDSLNITYFIFSSTIDTCISETLEKVLPYTSIDSIDKISFDYLIIIGGNGIMYELENHKLLNLIKRLNDEKKFILAFGNAPALLVKAEVCEDKFITIAQNKLLSEKLKKYKFKYVDKDVVSSKNLITSQTSNNLHFLLNKFIGLYNDTSYTKSF